MPTFPHELPLLLFRERPSLVLDLLHDALGVPIPAHTDVRIEDGEFTQIVPAQYHADLVLTLTNDDPVMGLIVEVQRAPDLRKHRSWPLYAAALHARLACPTYLVVVATDERVAAWARHPIQTFQPGSLFAPIVLGPESIPIVDSTGRAMRSPELAVLATLAHGRGAHAADIARAALAAAASLDEERRAFYTDAILNSLGSALREALENAMDLKDYEFKSRIFTRQFDAREARGEARAVLVVLGARGLEISEALRARILACTDLPTLDRWAARAVVVATAEEVIG